ncbi:MAG: succinate dehydrogenase cytochrome b subunit [Balneolales bacterium]|nr:succinate dehydrogenase cytochrome b subunit [Balneolales bacterium]
MYSLLTAFQNSVGRKILTGVTGIALTGFLIVHLAGNLTLFTIDYSNADNAFNRYAHFLHELGLLLIVAEIGLLAIFLIHAYLGIAIYLRKRKSRPEAYKQFKTRGGASKQGFSSRTMIVTGILLLLFTVSHVNHFKFGPGWSGEAEYTQVVNVGGEETQIRDLSKLVGETFQDPIYVIVYVAIMILLGFHLRHGIWSALQSLGAMNKKLTPVIYAIAGILGILIAIGFLLLPILIYFTV